MHAFDRQTYGRYERTDRQTDYFLIASPRWHYMQRGNKGCDILKTVQD